MVLVTDFGLYLAPAITAGISALATIGLYAGTTRTGEKLVAKIRRDKKLYPNAAESDASKQSKKKTVYRHTRSLGSFIAYLIFCLLVVGYGILNMFQGVGLYVRPDSSVTDLLFYVLFGLATIMYFGLSLYVMDFSMAQGGALIATGAGFFAALATATAWADKDGALVFFVIAAVLGFFCFFFHFFPKWNGNTTKHLEPKEGKSMRRMMYVAFSVIIGITILVLFAMDENDRISEVAKHLTISLIRMAILIVTIVFAGFWTVRDLFKKTIKSNNDVTALLTDDETTTDTNSAAAKGAQSPLAQKSMAPSSFGVQSRASAPNDGTELSTKSAVMMVRNRMAATSRRAPGSPIANI